MRYRIGLCLGLAALLGGACETTLDVELPDHPPQITVNSFFRPEAGWEIHLSEARSVADGALASRLINNATAEILEGGQRITRLLPAGEGLYQSRSVGPAPGHTYTLRVSAPGYESIEATDTVPERIPVTMDYEIIQQDTVFQISGQDTVFTSVTAEVQVTLQLPDPPEQNDYYRLFVLYRVRQKTTGDFFFFTYRFKTDDEAIRAENRDAFEFETEENNKFFNAVFSDALFDGEDHTITLNVRLSVNATRRNVNGALLFEPGGTLQAYLYNLSETYYDYTTTYDLYTEVRDNPFAEPVRVHTNVDNGFGIFAGFNRYLLEVDF